MMVRVESVQRVERVGHPTVVFVEIVFIDEAGKAIGSESNAIQWPGTPPVDLRVGACFRLVAEPGPEGAVVRTMWSRKPGDGATNYCGCAVCREHREAPRFRAGFLV